MEVTSNLGNQKNFEYVFIQVIFKFQYHVVLGWTIWHKWSSQRLFKTMISRENHRHHRGMSCSSFFSSLWFTIGHPQLKIYKNRSLWTVYRDARKIHPPARIPSGWPGSCRWRQTPGQQRSTGPAASQHDRPGRGGQGQTWQLRATQLQAAGGGTSCCV